MPAPLLGRERELDQLASAIDGARSGSGSAFLVAGEPGIGKSRLVEEVAGIAGRSGVDVRWGRAWEAGGAPPYWPWLQVLRELLQSDDVAALWALPRARIAPLAALLPEHEAQLGGAAEPGKLEPAQARFALLDAIASVLIAAARIRPRLVLLEDLHAADPASVELFEFVAGQARALPLVLVATYREAEAARGPSAALFQRAASRARPLALAPLARSEVADQLAQLLPEAPSEALIAAVHAATEGNPLFVVETARLLGAQSGAAPTAERGAAAAPPLVIPSSVRAVIRQRLAALAPRTREVLELGAVVGRDFGRAILSRLTSESTAELAVPLADAVDAAVLLELAPGQYRFGHILLREVLHQDLPRERREQLHLQLAELLSRAPVPPPASELAHHYLEAGRAGRAQVVSAAGAAAAQAEAQFAFGEAARLLALALEASEQLAGEADPAAIELRVRLGRALLQAGDTAAGKARCREAAEHARRSQRPELLAAAALAYGSVFLIGNVDAVLVELLREALERLPPDAVALRARVTARLAAALQPAEDPSGPIALAREAIALARTLADDQTLLEVLRAAVSAMMDLGDAHERLPLSLEHVVLAERLHDRVEILRGTLRAAFDHFELGDIPAARAAVDRCERIAGGLGHPHYVWRIACMQAMRAAFAGDFAQAERELARAASLLERTGDPNVARTLVLQRMGLLRQQGRVEDLRDCLDGARQAFAGEPALESFFQLIARSAALRLGAAVEPGDRALVEFALRAQDQTLFELLAEVAAAIGDPELIARMRAPITTKPKHFGHGGVLGMTWDGPLERALGLLAAAVGEFEEAEQHFARALERAEQAGSRTQVAWVAYDYGRLLRARGDHARAQPLLAGARELSAELPLPGMHAALAAMPAEPQRASSPGPAPTVPAALAASQGPALPRVADLRLERDGELWLVASGLASFRLKDSKGLRMLAQLVQERGRELHVFELAGEGEGGAIDTGDAGELIDPRARSAYRARIEGLRSDLAEAEANNDLGRAEQSRKELELLGRELARAVGLGGRARKSAAATERARVNVQRRLRDAIRRIGEQNAELEKHLQWAVKTGTFCSYDPS